MNTHETALVSSSVCAGDVLQFEFEQPPGYEFEAGQWFRLTLMTAEGEQTKTFSHASAPQEPGLLMATRMSGSAFKQALQSLAPGHVVRIQGPGGRLSLPDATTHAVFLTGGVGITPVRSILRAAAAAGARFEDALVVYGNRVQDCVPFFADLLELEPAGVRTVQVIEQPDQGWTGERGFIDAAMVRRYLQDVTARPFVVTGPPPMVQAMERVLDELGIEPHFRLIERFGSPVRIPAG